MSQAHLRYLNPLPPDLGEVRMDAPSSIPLERSTAAEYATSRGPVPSSDDHEELEKELGVDLSVRVPGQGQQSHDPTPEPAT